MNFDFNARLTGLLSSTVKRSRASKELSLPLGATDRAIIIQHLQDTEADLRVHDSEINRAKALIMLLESNRRRLLEVGERCQALLAPIERLPLEILKEIFIWAGSDMNIILDVERFRATSTPPVVVLSMVSSGWRKICLTSPGFWSHIKLVKHTPTAEQSDYTGSRMRTILKVVKKCLQRAGNHPLYLAFSFGLDEAGTVDKMGPILETLAAASSRWRSVEFHTPASFLHHPAFSQIENNLPILRTITLKFDRRSDFPLQALDFFHSCPSLERVDVDLDRHIQSPPFATLPWVNVRDVKARLGSAHGPLPLMEDVLRACPNLRRFNVRAGIDLDDEQRNGGPVVKSHIEVLSVNVDPLSDVSCFDNLILPTLADLTLYGVGMYMDMNWNYSPKHPLLACLERSSSVITRLSIQETCLRDLDVIALLRHTPGLQKLRIIEYDHHPLRTQLCLRSIFTSTSTESLRVSPSKSAILVPRLTELDMVVNGMSVGFDAESLYEAIISRWLPDATLSEMMGVACLQSVEVRFLNGFDELPETFLELEAYRDVGLRVSILPCNS